MWWSEGLAEALVTNGGLSKDNRLILKKAMLRGKSFEEVCLELEISNWHEIFAEVYGRTYVAVESLTGKTPNHFSLSEALSLPVMDCFDGTRILRIAGSPLTKEEINDWQNKDDVEVCYADPSLIRGKLIEGVLSYTELHHEREVSRSFYLHPLGATPDLDRLISFLFSEALTQHASDVHITPGERVSIDFRIDGELCRMWSLPKSFHGLLLNRLKLLSGMNIAEKILPQDGRFSAESDEIGLFDVRAAVIHTYYGEKMTLRLLPRSSRFHDLEALGLLPEPAKELYRLCHQPHGLIVLSGPTNSGKTTTLYVLLEALANRPIALYSIEDPVESLVENVQQIQINEARGMDFQTALRGVLRLDPDVLMIGELRDKESADIAMRAALTGHLVLTTLHTYDAQSVVTRLADLGVSRELIANGLLVACNQRLLAMKCSTCLGLGQKNGLPCSNCRGSGNKKRLVIQECWQPNNEERALIRQGADPLILRRHAKTAGFRTLIDDGKEKHKMGFINREVIQSLLEEGLGGETV